MFSRADQDGLLKIIPGSQLIAYGNTGHALHWEYPERFAKDLSEFMAR
jgi:pimeloyl-ACP methyl ester carboxylesterase